MSYLSERYRATPHHPVNELGKQNGLPEKLYTAPSYMLSYKGQDRAWELSFTGRKSEGEVAATFPQKLQHRVDKAQTVQ